MRFFRGRWDCPRKQPVEEPGEVPGEVPDREPVNDAEGAI